MSARRLLREKLDEEPGTEFIYTTGIRKIRAMKSRKKVIQGGTSAGKTYAILAILINQAASKPNTEISIVSESIPHLRRGALKDFLKIMNNTGRYQPDNFNKTHLKYEFTNGSYIEFFSVDDESKLRGARRNILFINETNNVSYEAYLQLSIRTSGDIYLDFNPVGRFWVHEEVLQESDAQLLIINYLDNEGLDDSIIQMLEENRKKASTSSYWKNWWDVYGLGKLGQLEGTVFNSPKVIDKLPEEARLIGYGMDFGYSQDPTTLIGVYKYNNSLILDEVIYMKGCTNSDISNMMKSHDVKGEILADSAEPKSIAELRRYGHNIRGAKKGRDSIMYGISLMQEYELITTRRSVNIVDEMSKYLWKKNKDGTVSNVPIDAHNHCIDAIRYLVMSKMGQQFTKRKMFKIG